VMGWLQLVYDESFSDQFCSAPVYGVPLNHENETFYFSFPKLLANTFNIHSPLLITIISVVIIIVILYILSRLVLR
jgi:hypothetical protein